MMPSGAKTAQQQQQHQQRQTPHRAVVRQCCLCDMCGPSMTARELSVGGATCSFDRSTGYRLCPSVRRPTRATTAWVVGLAPLNVRRTMAGRSDARPRRLCSRSNTSLRGVNTRAHSNAGATRPHTHTHARLRPVRPARFYTNRSLS